MRVASFLLEWLEIVFIDRKRKEVSRPAQNMLRRKKALPDVPRFQ